VRGARTARASWTAHGPTASTRHARGRDGRLGEAGGQARKDSLDRIKARLQTGVVAAIKRYTERHPARRSRRARAAFPRVQEAELSRWQTALDGTI
jgi:predicted nucleic acid-binding Zn ribbon protein